MPSAHKCLSVAFDHAGRGNFRQVEFPSTIETNSVRSMLDGEHPADVSMAASENKSENPD